MTQRESGFVWHRAGLETDWYRKQVLLSLIDSSGLKNVSAVAG